MYEECGSAWGGRRSKRHTTFCGKTYCMPFGRVRLKEKKLISTILNMKYGCSLDSFGSE
jgi:hypothetical protein